MAIDFALKELRGNAYVAVVRDALLAITDDRVTAASPQSQSGIGRKTALQRQAAAVEAAEKQYGEDMDTAGQAYRLTSLLRQLSDHEMNASVQDNATKAAGLLISRIGDYSNLILDPDLDSYYLMSVNILRLPDLTNTAVNLLDAATAVLPHAARSDASRADLLLKEGAFAATIRSLTSDSERAFHFQNDDQARQRLRSSFDRVLLSAADYSRSLRGISYGEQSRDPIALAMTLQPLSASIGAYWGDVSTELERLLRQRVERLYRRMAMDLGAGALVWLVALGLILVISRQITRGEAALARRSALLSALTYAATRLVGAADWRSPMSEFFSRLGKAIDVSRVFLFEIHQAPDGNGRAQSCRFIWSAPGVKPITDDAMIENVRIPETNDSQVAEWFRCRSRGEVIQVTRKQTRGDARTVFEETDTFSMLSVPIMVNDEYWGSLGFDDCRTERLWDAMEIDLLKTGTALIAGAIERTLADQRLRERDNQLTQAQRIAHVGSWALNFNTDEVSWSEEGCRIFGLEPIHAWVYGDNLKRIHPEDRQRVMDVHAGARTGDRPFDIEYRILRPDGEIRMVHERGELAFDETGPRAELIGLVSSM